MFLNHKLNLIKEEQLVSFHMPGHKNGRLLETEMQLTLKHDITEIPGADNLHAPEACIADLESALSNYYGSEETKILINGSTVGILSMIMGALNPGETLLINRNAHQSVYHAATLGHLKLKYLYPVLDESIYCTASYDLNQLMEIIEGHPEVKACVFTYPTYEGICYPMEHIVTYLHEKNILVLVDAAHGAHLMLEGDASKCILQLGADVVIHSFHKTLPAMTQTAALHFGSNNRLTAHQKEQILWHLKVLQTSSPSYVLMSSVDAMLSIMQREGVKRTKEAMRLTKWFFEQIKALKTLVCRPLENQEWSKIVIAIDSNYVSKGLTGERLSSDLREHFGIQVEFALERYVLLMASFCSLDSDFALLSKALWALDKQYEQLLDSDVRMDVSIDGYFTSRKQAYEIYVAMKNESILTPSIEALGHISAEFVTPYPPGIPILVPGEVIDQECFDYLIKHKSHIKVMRCKNE